jgi:hypothetical protein
MVVKLFFTDGTVSIRSFSNEELNKYKLLDKLGEYFKNFYAPELPLDGWEIFDKKDDAADCFNFDLRNYFNYSKSLVGLVLDDKVVDDFEFFEKGSYEHNLDSLENDSYERLVKFNYTMDHYYYSKLTWNNVYDPETE